MSDGPLQLALRRMHALLTAPLALGGMGLAMLLLAVAGPFGTFADFAPPVRFAYWAAIVSTTYVFGQGVITFAAEALRAPIPAYWPRLLAAGLVGSLPIAAIVTGINAAFYSGISPEMTLNVVFYVAVVTLAITVVHGIVDQRQATVAAPTEPVAVSPTVANETAPSAAPVTASEPAAPAILDRVPQGQRGSLLALSVADHYVDVVTSRGTTLVLMRLADAIREAAPVEGVQIHRSHWVARAAVIRTVRIEGKLHLELVTGQRLPVSRSALPAVRAAGLV